MLTKLSGKRCKEAANREEGKTLCHRGGVLVQSVVDFEESLPRRELTLSYEHTRKSEQFVVVNSSLVVTPAADMPCAALLLGAKLVIINQEETPFDRKASLRFHERIGDALTTTVRRLKRLMGFFE